jgi:hypothetical protein
MEATYNKLYRNSTILEILRYLNHPEQLAHDHSLYIKICSVGAGDTHVGSDLLTAWYARHVRIFSNLFSMVAQNERVLLLITAGHVPILRELIKSSQDLELIDTLDYL